MSTKSLKPRESNNIRWRSTCLSSYELSTINFLSPLVWANEDLPMANVWQSLPLRSFYTSLLPSPPWHQRAEIFTSRFLKRSASILQQGKAGGFFKSELEVEQIIPDDSRYGSKVMVWPNQYPTVLLHHTNHASNETDKKLFVFIRNQLPFTLVSI